MSTGSWPSAGTRPAIGCARWAFPRTRCTWSRWASTWRDTMRRSARPTNLFGWATWRGWLRRKGSTCWRRWPAAWRWCNRGVAHFRKCWPRPEAESWWNRTTRPAWATPFTACGRTPRSARRIWPVGQCLVCLGWGEMTQYTTCSACAKWRRAFPDRTACRRCGHVSHAGHDGLCRPCLQAVRHDDPEWVLSLARGRAVQPGFLIPGMRLPKAIPLLLPAQRKDKARAETPADAAGAPGRWRWLPHGNGDQPVSPHLINPAQLTLFQACRDWSCITIGSLGQLPSLTPDAAALLEQFHRHARARQWEPDVRWTGARSLRILLSWLGAEAPISEIDIRALASGRRSTSIRRMLQFLDDRSLVIPDPARLAHPTQRAIDERIGTLPGGLAGELCRWVRVLRGEGRRAHAQLPFATIRSYLNCLYPVMVTWADHVTSLREVTRDDI